MTCQECREMLVEQAEGMLDVDAAGEVAAHLERCADCRRESRMVMALRERLERAGQTAQGGQFATRVMEQVEKVEQEEGVRRFQIRHWFTEKRVGTRMALAAGLIFLAGLAMMMVMAGGSRVAFADVIEKVNKAKAVRCYMLVEPQGTAATQTEEGAGTQKAMQPLRAEVLMVQPSWFVIVSPGVKVVMNLEKGKMVTLMERDHLAMVMELKDVPASAKEGNLMDLFKRVQGDSSKSLGEKEIDGQKVTGFEVMHGQMKMAVWADAKTELPVLVEVTGSNPSMPEAKMTFSRFDWGPIVDESELSADVPEGYRVVGGRGTRP